MPIDYLFRSIDSKNIDETMKFIAPQDLGYPNWGPWTEKARSELRSGIKHGYALYNYGSIAGDALFQRHKQIKGLLEIKNVRIHPRVRQRRCASFMLRQIEFEMPWEAIIADAKINQTDVINLMVSQGYIPVAKTFLYDSNNQDIILIKLNNQKKKDKIIHSVKSFFNL